MSLALDWKESRHPDEKEERRSPSGKVKEAGRARKGVERSHRYHLVFLCFLLVAATVSGLLIFSVFLHVTVVQNEIKVREMERQIDLERRQQEEIRVEIASLESPARIEKIASEELKMIQVAQAEYLQTPESQAAMAQESEGLSSEEAIVSDAAKGGGAEDQDLQR